MVMDINGVGGRRRKPKRPQRGLGVEQLERLIRLQERQPTTFCTAVPNVQFYVQFSPAHVRSPVYLFQGFVDPFGFRYENTKVLSSIPIYNLKWINGGRNIRRNNTIVQKMDSCITRSSSGQASEVTSVHRISGSLLTEYEFFPEKGDGSMTDIGTSVGEMISGIEERSVSSLDLSLKLSY